MVLVAALGLVRNTRLQPERAAALGVEDAREHRGRVDVRQAQPVDRAVAGDQRGRATVADERVVADRRVAVDALHGRILPTSAPWGAASGETSARSRREPVTHVRSESR